MQYNQILLKLKTQANGANLEGMKKFGINTKNALGITVKSLRNLAGDIGIDHQLAEKLWASRIHEARILASMIDDPSKVNEKQLERWVNDFDSWDLCDQCCANLFDKTKYAYNKAIEWSRSDKEYVKRAGFSMMAILASRDKEAIDDTFARLLRYIKYGSGDERNFVKKAVNWALRSIGKRSKKLNKAAIETALEIKEMDSDAAKWIAANALRELESEKVLARFK